MTVSRVPASRGYANRDLKLLWGLPAVRCNAPSWRRLLVLANLVTDREFDGRARARALRLAAEESERLGLKYICMLNGDSVPVAEYRDFSLEPHVRPGLTDVSAAESRCGVRY